MIPKSQLGLNFVSQIANVNRAATESLFRPMGFEPPTLIVSTIRCAEDTKNIASENTLVLYEKKTEVCLRL